MTLYFLGEKSISEGDPDGVISRITYSYKLVTLQIEGPDQGTAMAFMTRREMHAAMEETQLVILNEHEPRMFGASIRRGTQLLGRVFLIFNDLHGAVERM